MGEPIPRKPKIHFLKTVEPFYSMVEFKAKTFEVRVNDRDFKTGDYLYLHLWEIGMNPWTDKHELVEVTYILDSEDFCKKGMVIVAIKFISKLEAEYHLGEDLYKEYLKIYENHIDNYKQQEN